MPAKKSIAKKPQTKAKAPVVALAAKPDDTVKQPEREMTQAEKDQATVAATAEAEMQLAKIGLGRALFGLVGQEQADFIVEKIMNAAVLKASLILSKAATGAGK
jgi:hypothetical protein